MEKIQLKAIPRTEMGKNAVKRIRKEKLIPGIYYDSKRFSVPLTMDSKDVYSIIEREDARNVLVELAIQGDSKKEHNTVIKDVQYHPVTGQCLHVDLHEISLEEKMDTTIHVVFTGESLGVKEGGIFETILREVEIKALPQDIPEHLEIDVSDVELGHSLHVRDLVIPEGLELLTDPNRTLVTIIPPKVSKLPEGEAVEEEMEEAAAVSEGVEEDATGKETSG